MTATITRRRLLRTTGAAAVLALFQRPLTAFGFQDAADAADGELIPFLDAQRIDPKRPMVEWQKLDRWITPNDQIFAVSHYGTPAVDAKTWSLEVSGLVQHPKKLTLNEIKQLPRHSVIATLECSGNSSSAGFLGAIGNTKWTGTPLKSLIAECAPYKRAIETVFYGADEKVEKIRDKEYPQNFARSLSLAEAMQLDDALLCYEMNGEPLTTPHGAPLRLVVPGRFGIDWIKWLSRIEFLDRRFMGKYQAREYVTIRGEERADGKTIWRETSVGPIDVKSIIARAIRLKDGTVRLTGAAWTDGTPLEKVEIQIDDGDWQPAQLQPKPEKSPYAWTFFTFDWKSPREGEHTIVSRATDAEGRIQPKSDAPEIRLKRTYWEANQQYPRRIKI